VVPAIWSVAMLRNMVGQYTGKDVRKKDAGNIEMKQNITSLIYSKSLESYWSSYDVDHGNKGH